MRPTRLTEYLIGIKPSTSASGIKFNLLIIVSLFFFIVILTIEHWISWILYLEDGVRIDDLSPFDVRQINGTLPINRDMST